jgi:hypothetical protein
LLLQRVLWWSESAGKTYGRIASKRMSRKEGRSNRIKQTATRPTWSLDSKSGKRWPHLMGPVRMLSNIDASQYSAS